MSTTQLIRVATVISLLAAGTAHATDVGVSITVGQPGFYGRIDIGNAPKPQLVYTSPVVITPPVVVPNVVAVAPAPVYLRVPPGHAKNWRKHCGKYQACSQPVYFVRDSWYEQVYVPHYRKQAGGSHMKSDGSDHPGNHGKGHGKGRGQGRD